MDEIITELSPNHEITKTAIMGMANIIGKVMQYSWLARAALGKNNTFDTAGELTQRSKAHLVPIASRYIRNYVSNHGKLKVLGMRDPVSLDSVYTQVNFDSKFIETFQTAPAQEKAFRDREYRQEDSKSGMEVARGCQCLMVLGGPGMGKTTFLRKVGLEALKQEKGKYQHSCIPVFLELRKYNWKVSGKINLLSRIAEEFQSCGLPEHEDHTKKLLNQGKLLVLFDGLDEVPTERLKQMMAAISDFIDLYANNRFIASCRIATYRRVDNLNKFTNVGIANFNENQIQSFLGSWFESHQQPKWGEECRKKLNSEDHIATRELAQTPLLLTLICILFLKRGEFPNKKATLYEKAISTLLEEWDASKEIIREKHYKGLDTKCKEMLLAEIAYSNFSNKCLFFTRKIVAQQIEKILQEMLMNEQQISGQDVLQSVEEQHGILVNRYEDLYSFSHLTIQEFLTAKHIIDNNLNIKEILNKYIYDESWHEVFLLMAGLRKADDLLLLIEQENQRCTHMPKILGLLRWVEEVTSLQPGGAQPIKKKLMAVTNAAIIAYSLYTLTYQINDFTSPEDIVNIRNKNRVYNSTFISAISAINTINTINTINIYNIESNHPINNLIEYSKFAISSNTYQSLNLPILNNELEQIQNKKNLQRVNKETIETLLPTFFLTPEMVSLSHEEVLALDRYIYGIKLLIECEYAAVRRSPAVWRQIEKRLLTSTNESQHISAAWSISRS
jgi:NACHT domain